MPIEVIIEHHAARIETCCRRKKPGDCRGVTQPGERVASEHVGKGGDDVRRAEEFCVCADQWRIDIAVV
jgi:hypothetical protein